VNDKGFLSPQETAAAIVEAGRRVLTQPWPRTLVLSLLAGFYIAFGAQLAVVVTQDAAGFLGSGVSRLLGGSVFSLGLMLVVICGAELFTGNILLVKAALQRQIPWSKIAENWLLVLCGNFVGALFFAWLMIQTDLLLPEKVAANAIGIAAVKSSLSFKVAFVRGIMCNWLVCLAVFMAVAARDIGGKILACYVPIMAFVTSGFEHSVANMYFIPAGILLSRQQSAAPAQLCWENFFVANLLPVTLGNIVGGMVFVAGAYWFVYLKQR
jgi:formate/nitrite transporter